MDRGSQLDEEEEADEEAEDEEEKEEEKRKATDIKSNNPHLAGGEKSCSYRFCLQLGHPGSLLVSHQHAI